MSKLEKWGYLFLLGLIGLAILSYLPAFHHWQWLLRVVIPELGLLSLGIGIPAVVVVGRKSPRVATALLSVLCLLLLWPWLRALGVSGGLKNDSVFFPPLERHPLNLGDRATHTETTEEYKKGFHWDRYTPEGSVAKARVLFIHGGSWRNGTRKDYPQIFRYLADRGFEVISLTYTLSGESSYPVPLQDVEDAIDKAYDPGLPLFLMGRSSGGHLALLASYRKPDKVRGVVGFYSPVDMQWSYDNPSNPAILNSEEAIVEFMAVSPSDGAQLYREASPLFQATVDSPPTLLIHGGADCLVYPYQSTLLSQKLKSLGVQHKVLLLPWMEHGGDVTIYGPSGRLSVWAIESFIENLKL